MNKIKKNMFSIILTIIVLFCSLIIGNAIFWIEGVHGPGELASATIIFALLATIVSVPIMMHIYSKNIENGLKTKSNTCFYKRPFTNNSIEHRNTINKLKETLSNTAKVDEVKVNSDEKVVNINYDDVLNKVQEKLSKIGNIEENLELEANVNNLIKNKDSDIGRKSKVLIDDLLNEYNIEKKLYLKARAYFDRSIFKKTLNPCIKEDKEVLDWEEIKLINDLGLLSQDSEFPYLVTFDNEDKSIRDAFEFINYVKNRDIFIPNLNNLDNLNNGFEFEEYVVNFLKNNGFTEIRKLSNFDKNGADILALKDNIRYAFSCKYFSRIVGLEAVKEILKGVNYHYATVAVVVTNSMFSKKALSYADLYNVQLWDRLHLVANRKS